MPKRKPYQDRIELMQGTLDMLVLRTLQWGSQHGHGIGQAIRAKSADALQIEHGSLYPALHRLERKGWLKAEWKPSEANRRAKYYSLTPIREKAIIGRAIEVERPGRNDCARHETCLAEEFAMKWRWSRIKDRERELNEEIEADFALEIQQRVEAGATREEAEFAARRDFGNVTRVKEVTRAMWGWVFLERLLQDTRQTLRRLRNAPAFTIATILTLALGIGATTAIFSVVNGELLKPLPYPHPGRLVTVQLSAPGVQQRDLSLTKAAYFIFREQSRTFQDIGIHTDGSTSVTIVGLGKPERLAALPMTDGLLPILGIKPLLGRLFTRADESPGSPQTAILTYDYWRRKFDGERSVIGRTINVDGKLRTIIGVLPRTSILAKTNLAMLLPIELNRAKTTLGDFSYLGIARLKPGVTLAQANADVARMIPIMLRSFPPAPAVSLKQFENFRMSPNLRPLKQAVVGGVGKILWVLMGGIGLVLLIACGQPAIRRRPYPQVRG